MTSPVFPQVLRSQAPRIPEGPLEGGVFSGAHPCLDRVPLANDSGWPRLHFIKHERTTWSSELPGLIEFDYRCRSFIAAHFNSIELFEKEKICQRAALIYDSNGACSLADCSSFAMTVHLRT